MSRRPRLPRGVEDTLLVKEALMSGMRTAEARAPSYAQLRPFRGPADVTSPTFPVHADLVETLLRAHVAPTDPPAWDPVVAHVLATLAGYAYSDAETVATIAARLGLPDNRCAMVEQHVDAMFICSTAFLLQSRCGRVAILSYRGTEPTNFVNWLTDADVNPEKVPWRFGDDPEVHAVHAGFYRNVRATRYAIAERLLLAIEGKPIVADGRPEAALGKLEALYVTGHSLGAAMAAMFGIMMETNPAYAAVRSRLRAVYTYGQPMIGDPAFARACAAAMGRKIFRFIHAHDVVAALPPRISGPFAHFGEEVQLFRGTDGAWKAPQHNRTPMGQVGHLFELPLAASTFLARQLRPLRDLPFQYSLDDHGPQHYIAALTPPGVRTEFGD
jgi:Lipase (class 3)